METIHHKCFYQNYLHKLSKGTLQRAIDKILERNGDWPENLDDMFVNCETSTSEEIIYSCWISKSGRNTPYGHQALPRLWREISGSDPLMVRAALSKLNMVLHNPEIAVLAIKMNLVARFVKTLQTKNDYIVARSLYSIKTLSQIPMGLHAIINNKYIIETIKCTVQTDSIIVKREAAATVNSLSTNYFALKTLIEAGFVKVIMECVRKCILLREDPSQATNHTELKTIMILHFDSLNNLLEYSDKPKIDAIAHNFFEFIHFAYEKCVILRRAVSAVCCQITKHPIGCEGFYRHGLITPLCNAIIQEEDMETKMNLATNALFATIHKESRKEAFKTELFNYMLNVLVYNNVPSRFRMTALQILTNFAELPEGKESLYFYFCVSKFTVGIKVDGSQEMNHVVYTLLQVIMKKP